MEKQRFQPIKVAPMILELVIIGIARFRSAVLSLCRWALSPPYALFSSCTLEKNGLVRKGGNGVWYGGMNGGKLWKPNKDHHRGYDDQNTIRELWKRSSSGL